MLLIKSCNKIICIIVWKTLLHLILNIHVTVNTPYLYLSERSPDECRLSMREVLVSEWSQTSVLILKHCCCTHTHSHRPHGHTFCLLSTVVCTSVFLHSSSSSRVYWFYPRPSQMFVQLFANKMAVIMSKASFTLVLRYFVLLFCFDYLFCWSQVPRVCVLRP